MLILIVLAVVVVVVVILYATRTTHVVLVEGNIAAGKSTFVTSFARAHPRARVEQERIGERLLDAFYRAPERYAFALQMTQQAQRAASFERAICSSSETILDRSVLGDYAFALWNTALGNLTRDEWHMYQEAAGETVAEVLCRAVPQDVTILFLNDASSACSARQRVRDQQSIDASYMSGVEAAHLLVMARVPREYKLVELYWDEYTATLPPARAVDERRTTLHARAAAAIAALQCSASARKFLTAMLDGV